MADAPSFRTSTRSIAANGTAARFTPCTPVISPAKPSSRWPFNSTSVRPPPRPRSDAVCAENVVAPTALVRFTALLLLFEESSCNTSTAVVAPERWISSRVMIVTASAPSPSTRLMLLPVTSTRMSGAGGRVDDGTSGLTACATALGSHTTPPAPKRQASAVATLLRLNSIGNPQDVERQGNVTWAVEPAHCQRYRPRVLGGNQTLGSSRRFPPLCCKLANRCAGAAGRDPSKARAEQRNPCGKGSRARRCARATRARLLNCAL